MLPRVTIFNTLLGVAALRSLLLLMSSAACGETSFDTGAGDHGHSRDAGTTFSRGYYLLAHIRPLQTFLLGSWPFLWSQWSIFGSW